MEFFYYKHTIKKIFPINNELKLFNIMPKFKVEGETPFVIGARNFSIGYSASGYTLAYSVNGKDFTEWEDATPANEVCMVNGVTNGNTFKLVGNVGEVEILFEGN